MTVCEKCHKVFNPWKCPRCDGHLENDKAGSIHCMKCGHRHSMVTLCIQDADSR